MYEKSNKINNDRSPIQVDYYYAQFDYGMRIYGVQIIWMIGKQTECR